MDTELDDEPLPTQPPTYLSIQYLLMFALPLRPYMLSSGTLLGNVIALTIPASGLKGLSLPLTIIPSV